MNVDPDGHFWIAFFMATMLIITGIIVIADLTNNLGVSVGGAKESVEYVQNAFIFKIKKGTGYSKHFDTGKPVNVFLTFNDGWGFSIGLDVNINGYGASIAIGTDSSIGIHFGGASFDLGVRLNGEVYGKMTTMENGKYIYTEASVNLLRILIILERLKTGGVPSTSPSYGFASIIS